MALANELIYEHRLRCGTPGVAEGSLSLSPVDVEVDGAGDGPVSNNDSTTAAQQSQWMSHHVLHPRRAVVFLDTDDLDVSGGGGGGGVGRPAGSRVPQSETRLSSGVRNDDEIDLVRQCVVALLRRGLRQDQIGVMSPYRLQLRGIQVALEACGAGEIEVLTVDRFQGRDKDVVIMSMVRSNNKGNIGTLLSDWRRINVAITRAKCKFITIGSAQTLRATPLLAGLVDIMDTRGWTVRLPRNAISASQ
eukprot:TRINITY_DN1030_c0_g4_i1.p3 TRINITY_DN1030_c0_g4~~TRINITY_DN1030_c0_g4_i1.p3  ORF type:complete len:248 (+),score=108.88 TRINITY_DN1030_c0_g4_i1:1-744(+)